MQLHALKNRICSRTVESLRGFVAIAGVASSVAQAQVEKPVPVVPGVEAGSVPASQAPLESPALRELAAAIELPKGFAVEAWAAVPGARHMAVSPDGRFLFVGTRERKVWRVGLPAGSGRPEVRAFLPSLEFKGPNGVCFSPQGELVIAEKNRVRRAAAVDADWDRLMVRDVVPAGQLVEPEAAESGHSFRTCRVGPDGKLYLTIGQPHNVQPRARVERYDRQGIGTIIRMGLKDGAGREVFAHGLRNSVGQDFSPRDGSLWFTDNQTDNLGDEVPPGELNRATQAGQHFGYPYWNGHFKVAGSPVATDLRDLPEPAGAVFPEVEFPAHQAQLGMRFYTGEQFPARFRGGIFVAAHGSWNRRKPTGALVNFVPVKADGHAGPAEVFAQGWLDGSGRYRGRPVDVAVLKDGSLLVSDDHAGVIWRIRYSGR